MLGGLYLALDVAAGRHRAARAAARRSPSSRRWSGRSPTAIVTGDPLHSLHGTADLAEAVDRRREHRRTRRTGRCSTTATALREPLVIGIPVGLFFAWRFRLPRGDPAARRRRGDDARVHDRPGLRAAADRALRAHAVGPADAVLRARRVRLAAAQRPAGAAAVDVDRDRLRRAVDRRSCPGTWGCSPTSSAASTATARCTPRCATPPHDPASGARSRTLRRPHHRHRPPAAPAPALVARHRPGQRRHDVRGGREPAARRDAAAARASRDAPLLPGALPARSRRRPAGRQIYRNGLWRVVAAPGCVTRPRA